MFYLIRMYFIIINILQLINFSLILYYKFVFYLINFYVYIYFTIMGAKRRMVEYIFKVFETRTAKVLKCVN